MASWRIYRGIQPWRHRQRASRPARHARTRVTSILAARASPRLSPARVLRRGPAVRDCMPARTAPRGADVYAGRQAEQGLPVRLAKIDCTKCAPAPAHVRAHSGSFRFARRPDCVQPPPDCVQLGSLREAVIPPVTVVTPAVTVVTPAVRSRLRKCNQLQRARDRTGARNVVTVTKRLQRGRGNEYLADFSCPSSSKPPPPPPPTPPPLFATTSSLPAFPDQSDALMVAVPWPPVLAPTPKMRHGAGGPYLTNI